MTREGILKHKEVFNKWLDGAEIQFLDSYNNWIDIENPNWYIDTKYRVRPKDIEDCHFNKIEYKVDKIGKVVEVKVDRIKINNSRTRSTLFKDKEVAEAYAVLPQLIRLRDEYNEGWKPDWGDEDSKKYILSYRRNNIESSHTISLRYLLSFKSEEIRNQFLEDYKYLIEIVKPLL